MAQKKMEDFAEVIAWFDSGRWSPENQEYIVWQPNMQLSPSQELLTHWLTYITDIQRPWQDVWKSGRSIFREISKAFSEQKLKGKNIQETQKNVSLFLKKYKGPLVPKGKVRKFKYGSIEYTPRFPNQHQFIERTLTIISHEFESDFVRFLGQSIKKRKNAKNALHYVAYDLYLLTYSNETPEKAAIRINCDSIDPSFAAWDRFGYKRIWAALRDYRKGQNYLQLLQLGLVNTFGSNEGNQLYHIWTTQKPFDVNLLELPGDVWNIKFMRNVVQHLADTMGVETKESWGSSYNARQIYNKIPSIFYPEQLDISFDLSARACENAECDLCPFSKNDLADLCLANTSAAGKKYCPILLATCTYRMICNPSQCPVIKSLGKGLCAMSTQTA